MDYFVVRGGKKLHGSIAVNTSKNAAVALLGACVINQGTTTLHNVPNIEEVQRWIEILQSIGFSVVRKDAHIVITPPQKLAIEKIDHTAATRTRSVVFLLASLAGSCAHYAIPQTGGCRLGKRTIAPHLYALESLGYTITTTAQTFDVVYHPVTEDREIILYETGDTVTENALIAAALTRAKTTIRFASANYMVQDLCFYLQKLGVKIEGVGTATLVVHGTGPVKKDVTYALSEDPIEAMFFLAAAIVTKSTLTITRCPIEFLSLELEKLRRMGLQYTCSEEYLARNRKTRLVDITVRPSRLTAPTEKVHPSPFPGLNIDNLPFFAPIACMARGRTLIHDWVYENRAIYFTELNRLGAQVTLMDPHRVTIDGPITFQHAEMMSPPALRPAALLLVAMLGAKGESVLRNVYQVNRGYENLTQRLQSIGADITLMKNVCA